MKLERDDLEYLLDMMETDGFKILMSKVLQQYEEKAANKVLTSIPVSEELLKNKIYYDGVCSTIRYINNLKKIVTSGHE